MNFNLYFGELHSDNSINDKNNLFENYIPKCYKVKRILISFNCFSEYSFPRQLSRVIGWLFSGFNGSPLVLYMGFNMRSYWCAGMRRFYARWCCFCLQVPCRDLIHAMWKKRPGMLQTAIYYHDITPSHRAAQTTKTIKRLGFELFRPPPYSFRLGPL